MSDQDQSNVNSQEQQENQQQNSEQEDQQDQDQDDQDQDQQDGSGDQDQDQDQQGSGDDQDEDQQDASKQQESQQEKKLPTFKMVARQQPEQFKFTSLLSEISSLSSSVDNFIGTLQSTSTSYSRRPINNYSIQQTTYKPRLQQIKTPEIPSQSRVVMMKDQDTQVDMKPQIIIQPTKSIKQDNIIQSKPYKISTQSQKFLAQLYEQNKKLKRWQTNTNHPMNSYMNSFSGSNGFGGSANKPFYASKDKFQRKQYQKGLFNVDERNKQIDEAILMLKRQQEEY